MNIRDFVDLKLLQRIQDLFSDATGLAAIAVDAQGEYITKGSNFTDFCMKYTRGSEEGNRRCIRCDTECTGTYYCHAGLMDFASDIIIDGNRVGAIIGGQVLPQAPDEAKFRRIAQELGIPEDPYIRALNQVPIRSEKMIRASADMLGSIVNQLVNLEYIKRLNAKKIQVFDEEITSTLKTVKLMNTLMIDLHRVSSMEKILAINASVEAAHAGQAGVGFAVVAQEIGKLSRDSSAVYGKITDLIDTVESSVNRMGKVEL